MSRRERGLSVLSVGIIALWMTSYFAYVGWADRSAEFESARLEVAPVSRPPELSEPWREPEIELAAPEAEPEPVGEHALQLGRELLDSGGAFPALNASYDRFGSFREYARSMLDLGAHFVVVKGRKIVASADIETASVAPFHASGPFSPIPRDYSSEPALHETARAARRVHGSNARVQMLLPRQLDTGLFGGIALLLEARGEAAEGYTEIQGHYEPAVDGGVWFRVESGTRGDGRRVELSRAFDLSALAAGGGSG